MQNKMRVWALFLIFSIQLLFGQRETPRLTVIVVVDQLAYSYFPKLQQFFSGGFRFLLDHGIVYNDMHHPHALPETAVGHTAFNTGTYAKYHGIVANHWLDQNGKDTQADQDTAENAAVFKDGGLYNYGRSAHHIMVDGISDQIVLNSTENNPNHVYAIGLKSYASIGTAGKKGKAIWFDTATHQFTSSKAYFDELPDWIVRYNKRAGLDNLKQITWKPAHALYSPAYHFQNIKNYDYAEQEPLVGKTTVLKETREHHHDQYQDILQMSPLGNEITFNLARRCIDEHLTKFNNDSLVIWLLLSPLDIVGHAFGPECLETIDMIYHIDKQLHKFMHWVNKKLGNQNSLFVLTADHGVDPIPELLNQKGIPSHRLFAQDWTKELNQAIEEKFAIAKLLREQFFPPYLWFDHEIYDTLKPSTQKEIVALIKSILMKKTGVRQVWSYDELQAACFANNQLESYFKNQLYPGRSGDIIIQTQPYESLTNYKTGTGHATPYESNTHVPFIVYQKGVLEHKTIEQKVFTLQWANTLANIFGIPGPSASTMDILPGIVSATAPNL